MSIKVAGLGFALVLAGSLFTAANAAPVAPAGSAGAGIAGLPIEQAQYNYGGRRYCFYWDGWHGPGWYWCGYHQRRGYGWGGDPGWRGWNHPPRPHGPPPRERRH